MVLQNFPRFSKNIRLNYLPLYARKEFCLFEIQYPETNIIRPSTLRKRLTINHLNFLLEFAKIIPFLFGINKSYYYLCSVFKKKTTDMKITSSNLARSLQGKGSCQQIEKEIASMLAGTDLVSISEECVRSRLKEAHCFLHEVARSDEEPRLFMKRVFSKFLCNEHITKSPNLCLIMHVAEERRRCISKKEFEELNEFICDLTMRRASSLSINWGIIENPEVKNMEIFIIASEPEKQVAEEQVTRRTSRPNVNLVKKGALQPKEYNFSNL